MDTINRLFEQDKDNPPLNKNQPPVAGSIYWERSLFHRIKHTIIRFLEVPEMLEGEQGKVVHHVVVLSSRFPFMILSGSDVMSQVFDGLNSGKVFEYLTGILMEIIVLCRQSRSTWK